MNSQFTLLVLALFATSVASFSPVPRPAIVRIVALNENNYDVANNDGVKSFQIDEPEFEYGDADSRRSISSAPSFDEYMKSRANGSPQP